MKQAQIQIIERETVIVPLNCLERHPKNMRTIAPTGIAELAESIATDGLLNPLTVCGHPTDAKKKLVPAGGRRLAALQWLVKQGLIPADYGVKATVVSPEEAESISLTENQMREAMHPIDQFNAFRDQVEAKNSITDVAARFGVTETFVKQRLKLAAVSPKLIEAYRNGEMTLEILQAFTVTDDQERQVEVWEDNKASIKKGYRDADDLKGELIEDSVSSKDKRMKYIGLKAYQKSGGAIIAADLFAEDDDQSETVSDPDLLDRLALEKLQKAATKLQKEESPAWCEAMIDYDREQRMKYGKVPTVMRDMTAPEIKLHAKLKEQIEAVQKRMDDNDNSDEYDDDLDDELRDKRSELEDQLNAIIDACSMPHPDAQEYAGTVVSIGHNGKIEIERNLIKQADIKKLKPVEKATQEAGVAGDAQQPATDAPSGHSEKLMRRMTGHKTAILRLSVLERGADALAVMVHHMLTEEFERQTHRGVMDSAPLLMNTTNLYNALQGKADDIGSEAASQFEQRSIELLAPVREHMKINSCKGLYKFLTEQPQAYLLQLLAYCVAKRTDLVICKEGMYPESRVIEADYLNDERIVDFWKPTRDNYLDHVSKSQMIAAVTEAVDEAAAAQLSPMKKVEAAEKAEQLLDGTGWLPAPMKVSAAKQ